MNKEEFKLEKALLIQKSKINEVIVSGFTLLLLQDLF